MVGRETSKDKDDESESGQEISRGCVISLFLLIFVVFFLIDWIFELGISPGIPVDKESWEELIQWFRKVT